jgi:hypothetical protein
MVSTGSPRHSFPKLTDKDTILLAEFTNRTSDQNFDNTLEESLRTAFGESPFLSLLSGANVDAILKDIGRPANTPITPEMVRALCERSDCKAYITGSIGRQGKELVFDLKVTECVSGEVLAAETKPHGISVFALAPGTVRTAMSEHSLNSPDGKKWIPWFAHIFDEGLTVPVERVAEFAAQLSSGVADALSGRFLSVADDLELLLDNVAEIDQENLYSLRVRKLSSAVPSTKFDTIRKVGEQAR